MAGHAAHDGPAVSAAQPAQSLLPPVGQRRHAAGDSPLSRAARRLAAVLLAGCAPAILAQQVALTGLMGQRALLVIDGASPVVLAPGETRDGVTLVSAGGDQAVVAVRGQSLTLKVGDVPVKLAPPAGASAAARVVVAPGPGGHFIAPGRINGASVQFLIDTGATYVSLSSAEADRIGLQYRAAAPVMLSTANGLARGYSVRLTSVRLGEAEVYNVQAIVTESALPVVLLGNSFLTHFQLKRENDSLILEKRF